MNPKKKIRHVDKESFNKPKIFYQKVKDPKGRKDTIRLNLDEYEALRLYHYKHLPQSECADHLNISQPTFSRILRAGIDKLVRALVEEKDFEILGGNIAYKDWLGYGCWECELEWKSKIEKRPSQCPNCGSQSIFTLKKIVSYFSEQ